MSFSLSLSAILVRSSWPGTSRITLCMLSRSLRENTRKLEIFFSGRTTKVGIPPPPLCLVLDFSASNEKEAYLIHQLYMLYLSIFPLVRIILLQSTWCIVGIANLNIVWLHWLMMMNLLHPCSSRLLFLIYDTRTYSYWLSWIDCGIPIRSIFLIGSWSLLPRPS